MKFSIVIPTVKQVNMVINGCIDSFKKYNGDEHEIIVVDDGSPPDVRHSLHQKCIGRKCRFMANDKNLGFASTVNKGIKAATGDVVILVNNDVTFFRNVIDPMRSIFEKDPRVGIVGSLLFYPDKTIQHGGIMHIMNTFTHRGWHRRYQDATDVHHEDYVLGVTGALFGIRKELVSHIGYLNEDFFLSCEDTEYCLRAWTADWRIKYSPDIQATHQEGGTRGNTHHSKMLKGRDWYIKELETVKKFNRELRKYDILGIQRKVNHLNVMALRQESERRPKAGARKQISKNDSVLYDSIAGASIMNDKTITVKRTGALGDVLLTTGIIRELKNRNPKYRVNVVTAVPDLFINNPHVDEVVRDVNDVSSGLFFDLDLAYESKPKIPIVQAYAEKVFGGLDFDPRPEMFSNESDLNSMRTKIGVNLKGEKVAVVHMATSWQNRTWPREQWMDFIRRLVSNRYKVVVVGKNNDFTSDLYSGVYNMVNKLTLHEIRELMRESSVFVSVDSGLLHVAMTTDIPAVALFTCANPDYRIVRRPAKTMALVPRVSCRFCLHEQKPPVTFVGCSRGDYQCLKDISPEQVMDAVSDLVTD